MTALDTTVLLGYFVAVTAIGFFAGRATKTTKDFFFAGRKYGWFLIAASTVATVVGSYSFVKYASAAYRHGFAATQNYLNDWMWVPLFIGAWLPILWLSGVWSVPEYFQKRFGPKVRAAVTTLLLVYMLGYIGINLRTLGQVLHAVQPLGSDPWWSQFGWSVIVAVMCAVYVTAGGQVSVILTDLLQAGFLLLAGFSLLWLGMEALEPHGGLLANIPASHRAAFTPLTEPANFSAAGLFWQDGVANSAAFYFVNQGLIMRFLSARNAKEGKKALAVVVLVLMPLAAIAVCGAGWIGRAMVNAGMIPQPADLDDIFVKVTAVLTSPGFFGLVIAALSAALMSTADTLINAVAAVTVNDVWKPYVRPGRSDRYYLSVARWASIAAAIIGLVLVPVFMGFRHIFDAHGMFTAAITPPLVVTLLLGMLWKRFTPKAALATLIGGAAVILLSMQLPELIAPFAHGVPPGGEGAKAFKYMRAFFGVAACLVIGISVSFATRPRPDAEVTDLVVGHLSKRGSEV